MMEYDSELILNYIDQYLREYPSVICEPDFEDILMDDLKFMLGVYPDNIYWDDITEPLTECIYLYYLYFMPRRSFDKTFVYNSKTITDINVQIDKIKYKSQTVQKTEEWYIARHNMITASNLYKIFDSVCVQNELIYEKCKPFGKNNSMYNQTTNPTSSLNWGNKYEPISIMLYEDIFSTKIDSVGCIPHDTYNFIGASPDGINTDPSSDRYGRLLEIKNVKSREIDGVVSKPYWVQTQIQMEVCNLNECDFLETKFIEYENYNDYINDNFDKIPEPYDFGEIIQEDNLNSEEEDTSTHSTKSNESTCQYKYVGVILHFYKSNEPLCYVYQPLHLKTLHDIQQWEEQMTTKYVNDGYQWITNSYWKLSVFNCVLILRNKLWFHNSINEITQFWNLIKEERITGYSHRAPKSKKNMVSLSVSSSSSVIDPSQSPIP
jgi:hypothetical protein